MAQLQFQCAAYKNTLHPVDKRVLFLIIKIAISHEAVNK